MSDSDISAAARASEVRAALEELKFRLASAGIDLADPRARALVTAFLAEGEPGSAQMTPKVKALLAYDMRVQGLTYRAIAAQLGWSSHRSAMKAVQRVVDDLSAFLADPTEVRLVLVERLEQMWNGIGPAARRGDPPAVRAAVRLITELRHLVPGLDVLHKDDVDDDGSPITVVLNIPRRVPTEVVPEGELGAVIEARALGPGDES